jgi:hypothetical protein
MSEAFDPYLNWLGIRDPKRPPNHYRLLGIDLFESDPEIISVAADRQMAHVRTFQTGKHSALSQRLLNEIAAAKLCLLNPAKKAEYDAMLRAEEAARACPAAPPVAASPPPVCSAPPVAVPPELSAPFAPPEGGPPPPVGGLPPQSVAASGGAAVWPPRGQRSGGLGTSIAARSIGPSLGSAGGFPSPTNASPVAPPLPSYDTSRSAEAPRSWADSGWTAQRQGELLVVVFLGTLILGLAAGLVWLRTHNSGLWIAGPAAEDSPDQQDGQQTDHPQPDDAGPPKPADKPGQGTEGPNSEPSQEPPSTEPQQPTPPTSGPEPMGPSGPNEQPEPQPPSTEPKQPSPPDEAANPEPPPTAVQQPPGAEPPWQPEGKPGTPADSKQGTDRLPVPSAEQQARSQKEIRELLRKDYTLATGDIKEKRKLANKLWTLARETTNDPVARFVLYCEARDEAAEAGDGRLFLEVIDTLGRQYELDELKMAAAALQRAIRNLRDLAAQKAIVEVGIRLARRANSQENYEAARALAETARDLARKSRDLALVRQAAATLYEVEAYARLFADFSKAETILSEHPEDPQANYLAGRYHCFVRNQWQRGLPMLAKGSNEQLRQLAIAELAGAADAMQKVELADRWRAAGESAEEMFQRFYYERAMYWYRDALSGLSGIDRTRVEKQLEELKKQFSPK